LSLSKVTTAGAVEIMVQETNVKLILGRYTLYEVSQFSLESAVVVTDIFNS